ncbi:reverse transcriptase [Tanacetum coccineum]
MNKIISPQQSAFIPGRQIQDCMVVANEAFHYIRNKRQGTQNLMALKVDLNKAFDRVEWDLLLATLRKLGFGEVWCNWIQSYVLSRQITKAMEFGYISGIKMARTCHVISHIFFADDSIFFFKASQAECESLVRILDAYSHASGQNVNFQKSSAFFSPNTPSGLQTDLCTFLQVKKMGPKDKYLGLPSVYGRKKSDFFGFLLEKVLQKMQGSKQKLLSQDVKF